jgi:integrase
MIGTKKVNGIGSEDVQQLKARLGDKAPKTVNNVLTVLNTLLKKALERDVIERMPCVVRLLPIPTPAAQFHDFADYDRLVDAAERIDRQTHFLVLLGGDAGLRCGEMMALQWADVDLHKRQICVQHSDWKGQVTSPKGGRLRYVPMTVRLATALRDHRHLRGKCVLSQKNGRPLTQKIVRNYIRRAARLAKVPREDVHVLRHTFCSHLTMRGAPAKAIQELAGHQDLGTTQRYMHLSPAALDAAIRLLETGTETSRGAVEK